MKPSLIGRGAELVMAAGMGASRDRGLMMVVSGVMCIGRVDSQEGVSEGTRGDDDGGERRVVWNHCQARENSR